MAVVSITLTPLARPLLLEGLRSLHRQSSPNPSRMRSGGNIQPDAHQTAAVAFEHVVVARDLLNGIPPSDSARVLDGKMWE